MSRGWVHYKVVAITIDDPRQKLHHINSMLVMENVMSARHWFFVDQWYSDEGETITKRIAIWYGTESDWPDPNF